jgi:hypothetical protein
MSRVSSGCVLTKVNQLFTCEKNCNSVEARKALLEDFTSKRYSAELGYVGSDGNIASKEKYNISFRLSRNQKDDTLETIHGAAKIQKEEDTPINLIWTGKYLAKKSGYKMRVVGDNIEKEFNLNCGENDKINFLIKKSVPEDLTVRGSNNIHGLGTMQKSNDIILKITSNRDVYGSKDAITKETFTIRTLQLFDKQTPTTIYGNVIFDGFLPSQIQNSTLNIYGNVTIQDSNLFFFSIASNGILNITGDLEIENISVGLPGSKGTLNITGNVVSRSGTSIIWNNSEFNINGDLTLESGSVISIVCGLMQVDNITFNDTSSSINIDEGSNNKCYDETNSSGNPTKCDGEYGNGKLIYKSVNNEKQLITVCGTAVQKS